MSGVHLIAILSAVATLTVIIELSRRRQLREKYALMWLAIGVVIAVFAIAPGLFNRFAHSVGVINPPDLLTVLASLFLLVMCVQLSWEIGRLEDKSRSLAEEVALLRKDIDDLGAADRPEAVTDR
jgi:hypothetical protein